MGHLPILTAAVVKCLEASDVKKRDVCVKNATSVLLELVRRYVCV